MSMCGQIKYRHNVIRHTADSSSTPDSRGRGGRRKDEEE